MNKQYIPLSIDNPAEILVAHKAPGEKDVVYVRFDQIESILGMVEKKWGREYPGSSIGIVGQKAIEILNLVNNLNSNPKQ